MVLWIEKYQFPPDLQLAITLSYLRQPGKRLTEAAALGIGDGATIERIVTRILGIILDISAEFIHWPGVERDNLECDSMRAMPYCIAITDGTSTRLFEKPTWNPDSFYSYKKEFCIKWQVTCDLNKKVRHVVAGQ